MHSILIVDDDPDTRRLLSALVTKLSCKAYEAANGIDGQHMALTYQPDLVLMDYMMPLQDGYVTCRNLRREFYRGHIVIISALSGVMGNAETRLCGADGFLPKPIELETLREYIKTHLLVSGQSE
jgi:DNA-binding response OmpR family regulator